MREEIKVYDKLGRAFRFPRDQWRREVLPQILREAWDDADMLRLRVRGALREDCAEELVDAARRLVAIDDDVVSAACLYAEVALRTEKLDAGRSALESVRRRRPDAAEPYVALAVYARHEGQIEEERQLLEDALRRDPNIDAALGRLLEIAEPNFEARDAILAEQSAHAGAWLPKAFRARAFFETGRVSAALEAYEDLVETMPRHAKSVTRVTGDLGNFGLTHEIVAWFAAGFDPARDGIYAGLNVVQALIAEEQYARADKLLGELFTLEAPECAEHLSVLEDELSELRGAPDIDPGGLQLALIEGPVWAHGLPDTDGLLPPVAASSERVLLLALVDEVEEHSDGVKDASLESFSSFSRSFPLYLAEALRFGSDAHPATLIPGIPSVGPILPSGAWDLDALGRSVVDDRLPELVVEGALRRVRDERDNYEIHVEVHDLRLGKQRTIASFDVPIYADVANTALRLEEEIFDHLERLGRIRRRRRTGIWQRPRANELAAYLHAHENLLLQAFVSNGWLDLRGLRNEATIYQSSFTLCERMPAARVPQAMLLRSLIEGHRYGSRIMARYIAPMREVLAESLEDGALQVLRPLDAMLDDGGFNSGV